MRTVRVTGAGTAVSPADSVEISLTVSCTRATTEAAVSETDGRVQALRASLARIGFAEKDCKTTSFDVSAEYENEHVNGTYSRKFKGYCCREVLKLAFGYTPKRLAEVVNAITAGGEEEFS
ncbi:MAG: SIMPL domain-containing protein, partial [Clostridiales bacterium]|nr:SIMPL domain-containing protein [Clostridiales bacterium]